MRHAKAIGVVAWLGALAACGMNGDDAAFADGSKNNDGGDAGSFNPSAGADVGPTAAGVVLLHAASYPAFRLCFGNDLKRPPVPDTAIMPNANVVGVEIGSFVRLDPLKAPGDVYVIVESLVRATPGTNEASCEARLKGASKLRLNNDYHLAGKIDEPLGEGKVSVLAITGCGSMGDVQGLDEPQRPEATWREYCNSGSGWNETSGNLEAKVIDLPSTQGSASATSLPVQLFQVSKELDRFAKGSLRVTFGALSADAGAEQDVPPGLLYKGGTQTALTLDQTTTATYGTQGFRIRATAGEKKLAIDTSLAAVQDLSAPSDVPTAYYRAASNYALLLIGDPTQDPTAPSFNPRRGVHLLAVPVVDPAKADAGADASADAAAN